MIAACVLTPLLDAHASNGAGVRTPPVYPRASCIGDVDRSVDPVFHLDIGLPREDLLVTDDEPADSRRFQFFAVCEDVHVDLLDLPNWITVEEATDALARGSIDAMPPDDDVLELRADLEGCVFPMNDASERIPISCEATEAGLDFDTSVLPAGNYVVRGYTYEPPLNLWSSRRGVVRVHDGDANAMPSVGVTTPALDGVQLRPGSPFPIRGCTRGRGGVDVELQWASLIELGGADDAAAWRTFATVDAAQGAFSIDFDPPEDAVGLPLLVRGSVQSDGTAWVDHAEGTLLVFDDGDVSDPPFGEPIEICGFYDPTDPTDPVDPAPGSTAGELTGLDSSSGATGESGDAGCACALRPARRHAGGRAGWLFLLGVGALIRRRRVR